MAEEAHAPPFLRLTSTHASTHLLSPSVGAGLSVAWPQTAGAAIRQHMLSSFAVVDDQQEDRSRKDNRCDQLPVEHAHIDVLLFTGVELNYTLDRHHAPAQIFIFPQSA